MIRQEEMLYRSLTIRFHAQLDRSNVLLPASPGTGHHSVSHDR